MAASTTPTPRSPSLRVQRRPSSPPSWPACTPATKSSCSTPAMTAMCPISSWPVAAPCACPRRPAGFSPPFPETPPPPPPPPPPAGAVAAHRDPADQRRGVRAHGVRRRRAPERSALCGLGGTRVHRVELWQDLPRHRLEGRHHGRPRRFDGRIPQGAPVQRVHRQHPDAAWPGELPERPRTLPATARFLPGQARPLSPRTGGHTPETAAQRGQLFSVRRHLRRERTERIRLLPMAHARSGGGRDPAVGFLWRRVRSARGAPELYEKGRHAASGLAAAAQAVTAPGFGNKVPTRPRLLEKTISVHNRGEQPPCHRRQGAPRKITC